MSAASVIASTASKPTGDRSNTRARSDRGEDKTKSTDAEQPTQSVTLVSPVTQLYRHALESVFAFLKLNELGRVLRVSQSWSSAVRSMPSIGAAVTPDYDRPSVRPSVIAASGLVSHIAEFGSSLPLKELAYDQLLVLSQSFPSLTSLGCMVQMPPAASLVFSPQLRTVKMGLRGKAAAVASIQAALVTLSQLPQLTDLSIFVSSWLRAVDFSPLLKAASLRHLRLGAKSEKSQPTTAHINQLRLFAHLQTMDVSGLDSASLVSLLRTPHQLQWQQIGRVESVSKAVAAALSSLPTLTHLEADECNSISFLPSLPRLRTLELHVDSEDVSADAVVTGLACCPQLTTLTLAAPVTSAHMSAILAAHPLLTDLTLCDCEELESLSFLESVDWTQRAVLRQLSLRNVPALSPESVSSLYCLRSLTSLTLSKVWTRELSEETRRGLRPPSALFPLLTEFAHSYEWISDDESD